jgi:hypothetical protein
MRAPILVASVWVVHMIIAAAFGSLLHAGAIAATEPHTALPDGRHLFHLAEVLDADKSLAVTAMGGAFASMLLAGAAWTVLAPFVIARLQGQPLLEVAEIGLRSLPAVAVQTVWHFGLRVVALVAAFMIVGPAPGAVKVLLLTIAFGGCALALDLVRVQVTLHGAARFHVRSALFAFVRTFGNPRFLAAGVGIYAVQMAACAAILLLGVQSIGDGSTLWAARLLSAVAVFVGFVRVAWVLDQGEVSLVRQPRAEES